MKARTLKRKGGARRRLDFGKRRKVFRRGKRSSAFTSQSGSGGGLRFRSRKTSRSAYNRILWNSSLLQTHYRANLGASYTLTTPANSALMSVALLPAMQVGGGAFWTAGGGAINPDPSNSLPTFTGNILLRGGMIGLRYCNTLDASVGFNNTLQGTIYLVRTAKAFVASAFPATAYVGWDPSYIQDFDTKVGKVVYKKNFLLKDTDTSQVEYRMKIRKIDEADYFINVNQYIWVIMSGNVDVNAVRNTTYTGYYNLSFTGDGV